MLTTLASNCFLLKTSSQFSRQSSRAWKFWRVKRLSITTSLSLPGDMFCLLTIIKISNKDFECSLFFFSLRFNSNMLVSSSSQHGCSFNAPVQFCHFVQYPDLFWIVYLYSVCMCVYGIGHYVYHMYLGVLGDQKGSSDVMDLEL